MYELMDRLRVVKMDKIQKIKDIKKKLSENGLYNLPVDILKFATLNGFKICRMDLPSDTTGILLVDDEEPIEGFDTHRLIAINNNLGYEKSRFIVGHEFAHFALHHTAGVQIARRDYSHATEPEEIEADEYAKLILMPIELVLRNICDNKNCIYKKDAIDFISDLCAVTKTKASDMISDMISEKYIKIASDSSLDKVYIEKELSKLMRVIGNG